MRHRDHLPFLVPALALALAAGGDAVLVREEFATLDAWRPVTFPKIARHTRYTAEAGPATGATWLRAESDASASGLAWRRTYDVREWPKLRWRWKVSNVYTKGDVAKKGGDDYPARVYVVFAYDPATAGAGRRLRYALAKAVRGEYPPDSGLSYVWANRPNPARIVASPYTDAMAMVLVEAGPARVGSWVEEEADVLADYRAAFGKDPPAAATLAVMSDSDDTGERATAWFDWIAVGR